MTAKRYKLSEPNGAFLLYKDKAIAHWIDDDEKIVELLNNLHEENRTLKGRIQEYEEQCKPLFTKKQLHQENQHIKHLIKEAYNNERTAIGKSVLKQLLNQME